MSLPPPSTVDLLDGADGMAGNPWPIYNVWQLQAIAGKMVSAEGKMSDGNLFGANRADRLSAHYRLTTLDIDATPTRAWDDGKGFSPIGDSANPFTGDFDGKGKAVKGHLYRPHARSNRDFRRRGRRAHCQFGRRRRAHWRQCERSRGRNRRRSAQCRDYR